MSKKAASPSSDSSAKEIDATLVIVKTIADTTWRMFVPPALGAVIGLQLEAQGVTQAAVWGAIIGVVASGLLVWQQYCSVNRDEGGKK